MAERIVKFRLITYFDEVDNQAMPGNKTLVERIANFGEKVDISREVDLAKLESLGALYTEEQTEQIEAGTYRGRDSALLAGARAGIRPASVIEDLEDEGPQVDELSAEELGAFIREQDLNVDQTLALVGDNPTADRVNKVIDAENIATDNQPRVTLLDPLEKLLAEVSQQS